MSLEQLFNQAVSDCKRFAELLEQEQEALVQHDMEELELLLQAKIPLIAMLNAHDTAINDSAKAMGRSPSQSMESFIAAQGDSALQATYTAFRNLLLHCQESNIRNARLVRHSQNANTHLMDLLRNQGETTQGVYDRQGLATRPGGQHTSIKV